jgi:hypothetical protein
MLSKYNIFALCNACGDVHQTGNAIMLQSASATKAKRIGLCRQRASIGPCWVEEQPGFCPRTGRQYAQTDYKQIFLVPIG